MGALSLRQSSAIAAQRIDDDAEPITADIEAGRALLRARLLDLLGGCEECGEPGCCAHETLGTEDHR